MPLGLRRFPFVGNAQTSASRFRQSIAKSSANVWNKQRHYSTSNIYKSNKRVTNMAKVKYYAKENSTIGTHSFYAVPIPNGTLTFDV